MYELDLVKFNQSCLRNVFEDEIGELHAKVAKLKERLAFYESLDDQSMESDPLEAGATFNDFYDYGSFYIFFSFKKLATYFYRFLFYSV